MRNMVAWHLVIAGCKNLLFSRRRLIVTSGEYANISRLATGGGSKITQRSTRERRGKQSGKAASRVGVLAWKRLSRPDSNLLAWASFAHGNLLNVASGGIDYKSRICEANFVSKF